MGWQAYELKDTGRKSMANLQLLDIRGDTLPDAEDASRMALFDVVNGQMNETQQMALENGTLGSNHHITVTIEGDGAVAARQLTVNLLEVEPRYMRAVIKALRHNFPGQYSTCLHFATVNGDTKTVGTIVSDRSPPTYSIVPDTYFNLQRKSQAIGTPKFVEWLNDELSGAEKLQALASSSGASSSDAPLLPPDADMLPLPAPPGGDAGEGSSDDEPTYTALPSDHMNTEEALADEQKAIEEADLYIMAMRNTRVPELHSDTLECILRMYDPGFLRSPMAACGGPIRPMPLPDFELEVA